MTALPALLLGAVLGPLPITVPRLVADPDWRQVTHRYGLARSEISIDTSHDHLGRGAAASPSPPRPDHAGGHPG